MIFPGNHLTGAKTDLNQIKLQPNYKIKRKQQSHKKLNTYHKTTSNRTCVGTFYAIRSVNGLGVFYSWWSPPWAHQPRASVLTLRYQSYSTNKSAKVFVFEWVSVLGLTSHSTHNGSLQRHIFPDNQLHRYWQPKTRKLNTTYTLNTKE